MRQPEFQLKLGFQTQFDPRVIPTGRRLKTSACSRFWPLFSRHFAKLSPLKLSSPRPLSDHRRESFRERLLPFDTRLSRLSKSRDPEVTGPCELLVPKNSGGSKENVR